MRKSVADPVADANINILGSINIIENARIAQVKKIIFASTGGAIYGDTQNIPTQEDEPRNPISPYGVAKLAIEHYLYYYSKVFGMKYVILRFANVYGPRQNSKGEAGVVAIFCDKILSGQTPVIFGDGKNTRDFVFVEDVAQANVAALESDTTGYYNVGTSVETDVNKLSEYIASAFGYRGEYIYEEAKSGEQRRSCLDFSKIKKNLGWEPKTSLKEGIEKTAQWFRKKT
ncbi:MAG: UDP-glucose 4-epimerase [Parcubacteria group bacterium GW2011_GWA2_38_13]|nr:MAG: UDP-glucose 4-epimerase [Parcubacteria group bacterium GW2011_GWA2_38_13]